MLDIIMQLDISTRLTFQVATIIYHHMKKVLIRCSYLMEEIVFHLCSQIEKMNGKGLKLQEEGSYNGTGTEFLVFWQCQGP